MKTEKEIEDLKANWKNDPCWDIEDTDGFEEHHAELLEWRVEYEKKWTDREAARIETLATLWKCSPELVKKIEMLEHHIETLKREIDS